MLQCHVINQKLSTSIAKKKSKLKPSFVHPTCSISSYLYLVFFSLSEEIASSVPSIMTKTYTIVLWWTILSPYWFLTFKQKTKSLEIPRPWSDQEQRNGVEDLEPDFPVGRNLTVSPHAGEV